MIITVDDSRRIQLTDTTTTEELIEFIIKQEMTVQELTVQHNILDERAQVIMDELLVTKHFLSQAHFRLQEHLINKATRRRHTSGGTSNDDYPDCL